MLYIDPRKGIFTRVMSKIFSVNLWLPHICTYVHVPTHIQTYVYSTYISNKIRNRKLSVTEKKLE